MSKKDKKAEVKPAAPVVAIVQPNAEVVALIQAAGEATVTALSKIKAAVEIAAGEAEPGKSAPDNHKAIMGRYEATFQGCDPNVKRQFSAMLTLLLAPADVLVEVPVYGAPTPTVAHVPAREALNQSARVMFGAATEAREAMGMARNKGAGRPAVTPTGPKVAAVTSFAPAAWADSIPTALADAGCLAKVIAALEAMGYSVVKREAAAPAAAPALPVDTAKVLAAAK